MKKRKIIIKVLIAAAFAAALFAAVLLFENSPEEKIEPAPAPVTVVDIVDSRREADGKIESSVRANGAELFYDSAADMYYYSLVGDGKEALEPELEAYAEDAALGALIDGAGITQGMMSENVPLEAVVYSDTEYRRIKIRCTTLPLLSLDCSEDELDRTYVPVTLRVFDNREDAAARLTVVGGKIKIRGNSSALYDKKAYRITLLENSGSKKQKELDVSLLGMREDDDWVLYAAYNDQERIRNVFSTNLWYDSCAKNNSFGIDNGNEYRFVELFMNGEYRGLYALGYPVDDKQLGTGPEDVTYQKITWNEDLSLDYLDNEVLAANFEIKEGNKNASDFDVWSPLAKYFLLLQRVDSADKRLYEISDTAVSVDIFLFLNLVQGFDNVNGFTTLNLYQTAKMVDGSQIMFFTPWDLDQTWGNRWNTNSPNWIAPYTASPEKNMLMKANPVYFLMMYGDEQMLKAVKDRYWELRAAEWSDETLGALIDEYEKQIFFSGAYLRDVERWPESSMLEDPSVGLSLFREFVTARLAAVDKYMTELKTDGLLEPYAVNRNAGNEQ